MHQADRSTPSPRLSAEMLEMEVDRRGDEVVVIRLTGELCLASAAQLEQRLKEILQTGAEELIVDLRELSFIDSTGIRLLIELDERADIEGWSFAIVPGEGAPHRTLELAGLQHHPRRLAGD